MRATVQKMTPSEKRWAQIEALEVLTCPGRARLNHTRCERTKRSEWEESKFPFQPLTSGNTLQEKRDWMHKTIACPKCRTEFSPDLPHNWARLVEASLGIPRPAVVEVRERVA